MLVSNFLKSRLKSSLNCQTLKKSIKRGDIKVVSWHVEEKFPIFDSTAYSANLAASCGLPEVLDILLKKGYRVTWDATNTAVIRSNLEVLKVIQKYGVLDFNSWELDHCLRVLKNQDILTLLVQADLLRAEGFLIEMNYIPLS